MKFCLMPCTAAPEEISGLCAEPDGENRNDSDNDLLWISTERNLLSSRDPGILQIITSHLLDTVHHPDTIQLLHEVEVLEC